MNQENQEKQLTALIKQNEVSDQTAVIIEASFIDFINKTEEWRIKAESLVVTDASQVKEMTDAKEARLVLKKIRVEADKTRKELKKDSLSYGKAVQSVYNLIEEKIKPIEEHLKLQEDFVEIQAIKKRVELRESRQLIVQDLTEYIPSGVDLGTMTDVDFQRLLSGAEFNKKAEAEAKIKAVQEAEQKAAEIKAAAEERERKYKEEATRLKAEAFEREAIIAEQKAKAEEEKAFQEKKSIRDAEMLKAAEEEKEKLAEELKNFENIEDAAILERKRTIDSLKVEVTPEKENILQDRDKLLQLANDLMNYQIPEVVGLNAKRSVDYVRNMLFKLGSDLETYARTPRTPEIDE